MKLRSERSEDSAAIRDVLNVSFNDPTVAWLVDLVRASDRWVPDLSIVAEVDRRVVGHVMLSYVTIEGDESRVVLSLAPLGVHPDHQGRGIGSALAEEALARAEALSEPLVVLEGHPGYYPRFGFEPAVLYGIEKADPGVPDEAFMVRRLSSYTSCYHGRLVYPAAFHESGAIGP